MIMTSSACCSLWVLFSNRFSALSVLLTAPSGCLGGIQDYSRRNKACSILSPGYATNLLQIK